MARKTDQPLYVAAFSIEDGFKFRLSRIKPEAPFLEAIEHEYSTTFPILDEVSEKRGGALLQRAFHDALYGVTIKSELIKAITISTVGVVKANRFLSAVPREEWSIESDIDFASLIAGGLKEKPSVKSIADRLFVYNDATASAAAIYDAMLQRSKKKEGKVPDTIVYLKVHHGVNFGVVEQFKVDGKLYARPLNRPYHSEAGHIYPSLHRYDHETSFKGVCVKHRYCLEGMVSRRAILKRAVENDQWPQDIDEILETGDAIDIVSHYLVQIVHQIYLSPYTPSNIIVGGKLATPEILNRTTEKLKILLNGYPDYGNFVDTFLVHAQEEDIFPKISIPDVELLGAIFLAKTRALTEQDFPGNDVQLVP